MDLQTIIRDKISTFLERVRTYKETGAPIPLNRAFMALAGDVIMQYCFSVNYDHLSSPDFKTTLHEPFLAASISGHLSLQFPIVPKLLFMLPESILVKIEPLYAQVFRMQRVELPGPSICVHTDCVTGLSEANLCIERREE